MDVARIDTLARALDARSRRRVLGSLSGVVVGAFGSVMASSQASAKKKGNKKHDGKNGKNTACPICPESPVCPDSAVCPEPPPAPTCAQACGLCILCYTRAADSHLCSFDTRFITDCENPSSSCSSDNDCVGTDRPYCVTHVQARGSVERFDICAGSPGGHCTTILARCSA